MAKNKTMIQAFPVSQLEESSIVNVTNTKFYFNSEHMELCSLYVTISGTLKCLRHSKIFIHSVLKLNNEKRK